MQGRLRNGWLVVLLAWIWLAAPAMADAGRCDALAASPQESGSAGVPLAAIEVRAAEKACKAALKRNPNNGRLHFQLARVYLKKGRPKQAVAALRQAVSRGHALAGLALGELLSAGEGMKTADPAAALAAYHWAAEQGLALALTRLGYLHETGTLVPKDEALAVRLYERAAERGDANAAYNLGVLYEEGRGVTADPTEAALWYQRAGEAGLGKGYNALGTLAERGWGLDRSLSEAERWYRKGAALGDADAMNNLAHVLAAQGKALDEALDFSRQALVQHPGQPTYQRTREYVLLKMGAAR